jgi:tellurite resistance protein
MKLLPQPPDMSSKVIEAHESFGWTSPGRRRMQADALRRQRARGLRHDCIAGLRILRYVAMADGVVTVEELNVIASYIEGRLALLNVEHDAELTAHLMGSSATITVTPRSLQTAVNEVAKNGDYFTLVLDCALALAEVEGDVSALALHVLETLATAGSAAGWLAPGEAASRLTNLCLGTEWAVRA